MFSLVDERGKSRPGFVGIEDIYNLTLPADLIVLSGCDTALGKELQGEGVVGVTHAFPDYGPDIPPHRCVAVADRWIYFLRDHFLVSGRVPGLFFLPPVFTLGMRDRVMSRNTISGRNSVYLLRISISEFVAFQRIFAKIN